VNKKGKILLLRCKYKQLFAKLQERGQKFFDLCGYMLCTLLAPPAPLAPGQRNDDVDAL
jgi:hypothetical protein